MNKMHVKKGKICAIINKKACQITLTRVEDEEHEEKETNKDCA